MKLEQNVNTIKKLILNSFDKRFTQLGIGKKVSIELDKLPEEIRDERQRIDELISSHIDDDNTSEIARAKVLEELTFTLFNRITALKVMERKGIIPPVITKDHQHGGISLAHKVWLERNKDKASNELEGLREFIIDEFDNHGKEIELFSSDYIFDFIPDVFSLNEIINEFNKIDDSDWQSDDIMGWLYESYNQDEKKRFKESEAKIEWDKVALTSQVYTPKWVVKFLVDNSLGKLWLEMHPESRITEFCDIANAPKPCNNVILTLSEEKGKNPKSADESMDSSAMPQNDSQVENMDSSAMPQNDSTESVILTLNEVKGKNQSFMINHDLDSSVASLLQNDNQVENMDSSAMPQNDSTGIVMLTDGKHQSSNENETLDSSASPQNDNIGLIQNDRIRPIKSVKDIKLIDPAPGSGNFLLYAFDLFYELYKEEGGYDEDDIPKLIIENNLYGIDIDERAVQIAQLGLYIKAKEKNNDVKIEKFHIISSGFLLPEYDKVQSIFEEGIEYEKEQTISIIKDIWNDLRLAHKFGSLLRIEEKFNQHIDLLVSKEQDLFQDIKITHFSSFRKTFFERLNQAIEKYQNGSNRNFLKLQTKESLSFLQILSQKYDVAVANPPYTDSGNYGKEMKKFIEDNYKKPLNFYGNHYSCFLKRCADLIIETGKIALLHPPTFMYIKSFEDSRKFILDNFHINLFVEWGYLGLFNPSARVDCAFYILEDKSLKSDTTFIKLNDLYELKRYDALMKAFSDYLNNVPNNLVYTLSQEKLKLIKSYPFIYWISDEFREKFKEKALEEIFYPVQGAATTNNNRFLRFWWEVESEDLSTNFSQDRKKWVGYSKGGSYSKWYGNLWLTLNWQNQGKELKEAGAVLRNSKFYLKNGVTYSASGSKGTSYRILPNNFIFDTGGSCIFTDEEFSNVEYLIAFLNSKLTSYLIASLNPTVNTQVGDMERVPFALPKKERQRLDKSGRLVKYNQEEFVSNLAKQCVEIKKHLCEFSLIEMNYKMNPIEWGKKPNGITLDSSAAPQNDSTGIVMLNEGKHPENKNMDSSASPQNDGHAERLDPSAAPQDDRQTAPQNDSTYRIGDPRNYIKNYLDYENYLLTTVLINEAIINEEIFDVYDLSESDRKMVLQKEGVPVGSLPVMEEAMVEFIKNLVILTLNEVKGKNLKGADEILDPSASPQDDKLAKRLDSSVASLPQNDGRRETLDSSASPQNDNQELVMLTLSEEKGKNPEIEDMDSSVASLPQNDGRRETLDPSATPQNDNQEAVMLTLNEVKGKHPSSNTQQSMDSSATPQNDDVVKDYIKNLTVTTLSDTEILELKSKFQTLYQKNNNLEEFCISNNINPINVWYLFKNSNVVPSARAKDITMEFLADILRDIMEHDDDGILPLTTMPNEKALRDQVFDKIIERGFNEVEYGKLSDLLGRELNEYLENYFFKDFSDHLNLFMYLPKTPFIWHITSGQFKGFEAFISIYRWSADNLKSLKANYSRKRQQILENKLSDINLDGSAKALNEKELIQNQLREIEEFHTKFDDLIESGYNPILDDGVGKNIAPLQVRGMLKYDVLNKGQLEKYLNADW